MALWCHTVMSRVQGNTINTMARMSLLFGISRVDSVPGHYLDEDGKVCQCEQENVVLIKLADCGCTCLSCLLLLHIKTIFVCVVLR